MILPYSKAPFFTCYNYMLFPFNIIESNSKSDITKWMVSKAFNVQFDHTSVQNKFTFVVDDPWGIGEGLTTSQYVSLQKKMMTGVNIDIVAFFNKLIDSGHYIHCGYSEKRASMITNKDDYHSPDFLIYGYLDKYFYISSTCDEKNIGLLKLSESELLERMYIADAELLEFSLFKYNKNNSPQYLKEKAIKVLEEYISGGVQTLEKKHYGINAITALKCYIESYEVTKDNFNVLLRYLRAFSEHKKLLLKFVYLLFDDKEIESYVSVFQKNYELAKSIECKLNNHQFDNVIYMFDEITENEIKFVPIILNNLKNDCEEI